MYSCCIAQAFTSYTHTFCRENQSRRLGLRQRAMAYMHRLASLGMHENTHPTPSVPDDDLREFTSYRAGECGTGVLFSWLSYLRACDRFIISKQLFYGGKLNPSYESALHLGIYFFFDQKRSHHVKVLLKFLRLFCNSPVLAPRREGVEGSRFR